MAEKYYVDIATFYISGMNFWGFIDHLKENQSELFSQALYGCPGVESAFNLDYAPEYFATLEEAIEELETIPIEIFYELDGLSLEEVTFEVPQIFCQEMNEYSYVPEPGDPAPYYVGSKDFIVEYDDTNEIEPFIITEEQYTTTVID